MNKTQRLRKLQAKRERRRLFRETRRSDKDRLFTTEQILQHTSPSVLGLLQSAMSKKNYHDIKNDLRIRMPYMKLSDAKKRKTYKLPFKILWPASLGTKQGSFRKEKRA